MALARLEGALPFITPEVQDVLAMRSLRQLWRIHVRDYPFDSYGLEHDPGLDAAELVRSRYSEERSAFLSWISRRASPALAAAAVRALAGKGLLESWSMTMGDADIALDRLDALLPSPAPQDTVLRLVRQLRTEEVAFLETDSEMIEVAGYAFTRAAPRGAAWAASLAIAARPQLFALGAAPLALAGITPREMFRPEPEREARVILDEAIAAATARVATDLDAAYHGVALGQARLAGRYASSRTRDAWALLLGLGPLTRAELARALRTTARTASQVALALASAELVTVRPADGALMPIGPHQ